MSNEPTIYEIPEWNVETLHKEIAKLNKRAAKLGAAPLELVEHGTREILHPKAQEQVDLGVNILPYEELPRITLHLFQIKGVAPKLAGWEFIGRLDHVTLPGEVIVNAVPGETVPEHFFKAEPVCGHCKKKRYRNDTFIMRHEDGPFIQVGRQCLKDFLGHDPSGIARYLTSIWKLLGSFGDEEDERWHGGYGNHLWWTYPHEKVLSITTAFIRSFGWVPRSTACPEEGRPATADEVAYFMSPSFSTQERKDKEKLAEKVRWDAEKDGADAKGAMEWLKEQDANNEYMANLHTISRAEGVPVKLFGYWCSLVATYQRAQERLRVKMAQRKTNEWFGNVKDRVEINVRVIGISYHDGAYGTVAIHRMLDDAGRTVVWFANTRSGMSEGHRYHIKGTIKKHDEFQDWKQTVLTRVKMLEELEDSGSAG